MKLKKKTGLAIVFFAVLLTATLASANDPPIISTIRDIVTDNGMTWESNRYATCDLASCYLDFQLVNNYDNNAIYTPKTDFKITGDSRISTARFYVPTQIAHSIPIFGWISKNYLCLDKIGLNHSTYYCYRDDGKNLTYLFNQPYTWFDISKFIFYYTEYEQTGSKIEYTTEYIEASPASLSKGISKSFRLYFNVPPGSSGKFNIEFYPTISSSRIASKYDPYWYAGNTLYRWQQFGMVQTTLVYPANGTSTVYLHDGATMLYGQNCSIGTNKTLQWYANDSTHIAGLYNSTPTKCSWGSTFPTQIDLSSAVTNLVGYWTLDEASGSTAYDLTNWSSDGAIVGAATNQAGKVWKSQYFTTDDNISIADPADGHLDFGTGAFSISLWVNVDATDAQGVMINKFHQISTTYFGYDFYQWNTGSGVYDFCEYAGGTGHYGCAVTTSAPTSNWDHLVGVRYSNQTVMIFMNGVRDGNSYTHTGANIDTTGKFLIGVNNLGGADFAGYIDDVQVWNKALSQAEITALYGLGATVGAEETLYAVCGDNITEGSEQCDGEICCSDTCTFNSSSDVCRPNAGICDSEELCTGSSADCPADTYNSTDICRASGGICDMEETCNGTGITCPTDSVEPNTTICRASVEYCDPTEYCTGSNITCPSDISNCTANLTIAWGQRFACTNSNFTLWVIYGNLTDANVTATMNGVTYNLTYNSTTHRYEGIFSSNIEQIVYILINASRVNYPTITANGTIEITTCFSFKVRLWEQVELQTIYQNNNTIITDTNYNKQLIDPYINDFGVIIAKNNNHNATGEYSYCNVPFGSGQTLGQLLNIGNWMGTSTVTSIVDLLGDHIGCNKFWFRAPYYNGEANLTLLWKGNYSLYFVDGTMTWENQFSPPQILKSNLFMQLGEVNIPDKQNLTLDIWLSHEEIDFWATWTDTFFIFFITLLPILIFIGLAFIGIPLQIAGLITIMLESIWFMQNIFHFF